MFEFNEDDLKANQRGQLSPRQREWLRSVGKGGVRMQSGNIWIAVAFLFLGLCIILGLYFSNEDSHAALLSNPSNLLIFPVIVGVVAGILILSILLARWNANRLATAMLSSTSGIIVSIS
jgi:hypothetical protein